MTTTLRKRLNASLGGIKTPRMDGDNLAILLCSYFDNPEQENDDETVWTPDAIAGMEEVLQAIRDHFEPLPHVGCLCLHCNPQAGDYIATMCSERKSEDDHRDWCKYHPKHWKPEA